MSLPTPIVGNYQWEIIVGDEWEMGYKILGCDPSFFLCVSSISDTHFAVALIEEERVIDLFIPK